MKRQEEEYMEENRLKTTEQESVSGGSAEASAYPSPYKKITCSSCGSENIQWVKQEFDQRIGRGVITYKCLDCGYVFKRIAFH